MILLLKTMLTVSHTPTSNNNTQINAPQKALNKLLFSDCVKISDTNIQITSCSPDVDVIINKKGGICTKCKKFFKSNISLHSHIQTDH